MEEKPSLVPRQAATGLTSWDSHFRAALFAAAHRGQPTNRDTTSGTPWEYALGAAVSARAGRRPPPAHCWVSSRPTERFQFPLRQEPPVVGVVRHPPHGRRRHEHERPPGGAHVLRHAPFAPRPVIEGPSRPRRTPARLCECRIHDSPGQQPSRAHVGGRFQTDCPYQQFPRPGSAPVCRGSRRWPAENP